MEEYQAKLSTGVRVKIMNFQKNMKFDRKCVKNVLYSRAFIS